MSWLRWDLPTWTSTFSLTPTRNTPGAEMKNLCIEMKKIDRAYPSSWQKSAAFCLIRYTVSWNRMWSISRITISNLRWADFLPHAKRLVQHHNHIRPCGAVHAYLLLSGTHCDPLVRIRSRTEKMWSFIFAAPGPLPPLTHRLLLTRFCKSSTPVFPNPQISVPSLCFFFLFCFF